MVSGGLSITRNGEPRLVAIEPGVHPGHSELARVDLKLLDREIRLLRTWRVPVPAQEVVLIGIDDETVRLFPEPLALWHRHFALLLRGWSSTVSVVTDGQFAIPDEARTRLLKVGIHIDERKIARLSSTTAHLEQIEFTQGPPLAVMDIAGAQAAFGWLGRISRIDVRLVAGADRDKVLRELALPAAIRAASPDV